MMNILQVNSTDFGGGAERSSLALVNLYRKWGYQSWLAVGTKTTRDPNIFMIPRTPQQLRLYYPNPFLSYWAWFLSKVSRVIERELGVENFNAPGTKFLLDLPPQRPDILHLHNLHIGYFDLRCLPRFSREIPVILNLRDMWLLTGHCAYSLNCERWKIGCGHCPDLTIYPAVKRDRTAPNWQRKDRIFKTSCLYVTAPSQWLIDQARMRDFGAVEYRLIVNGIDLEVFKPGDRLLARENLSLPRDKLIILIITHSQFKDQNLMYIVLNQLPPQVKDRVTVVQIQKASNVETDVGFDLIRRGTVVDVQSMAQYYQAADIYLHAAKGEVFGRTIVESMACGTPVIATAVQAIPELIRDGENGFLAPAGDAKALSVGLNLLINDPDLRSKLGRQGMIDASQKYDLIRQGKEFTVWYEEILSAK